MLSGRHMSESMLQEKHKGNRGLKWTIAVLVLIAVAFYIAVFAKYW